MPEPVAGVRIESRGPVARLVLARPEVLNALNRPMLAQLIVALDDLRDRGEARVLVLSGEGRCFCSGADMSGGAFDPTAPGYDAGEVLEHYYNPLIERLSSLPIPVIASVHGAVAGAGCMLALAADFVIAARSAFFLQAFINVGLVPDAGSLWLLPRLVGRSRAMSMMMLGERIAAETAHQWGVVHAVVEDAEREAVTASLASRLAAGPTLAYGLIRRGVRAAAGLGLSDALALEREAQRTAGASADFAEGVAAFRGKRSASFRGE